MDRTELAFGIILVVGILTLWGISLMGLSIITENEVMNCVNKCKSTIEHGTAVYTPLTGECTCEFEEGLK